MLMLLLLLALFDLFALIVVILYVLYFVETIFVRVPYVRTRLGAIDQIIKALDMKDGETVYDLGCGDAVVLRRLLKANSNIKAVGFEIVTLPFLLAKIKSIGIKNLEIKRQSLFKADFSKVDKIYTYLGPDVMKKLEPIVLERCKKGTRIVSLDFAFKNIKPIREEDITNTIILAKKLYIYEI